MESIFSPLGANAKLYVIKDSEVKDSEKDTLCDKRYKTSAKRERVYPGQQYAFDMGQADSDAYQDTDQNDS